ncbi:MAG: hypothetical protein DMF86_09735 [Acidobacteria bacterium]|nr:MAG: hypothetical protein DMF86_09735 [Acidobacteriota bacterium]
MEYPFRYDHIVPLGFGGTLPHTTTFDDSAVVVLPIPVDRTTSYVGGTRMGPHEILQASSHMELWDEELGVDVHGVGIFTLPEMELPFGEVESLLDEIERVAYEVIGRDKFLLSLGGEHSITPALVSAAARKYPGLSVLRSRIMRARCAARWNTRGLRKSASGASPPTRQGCSANWRRRCFMTSRCGGTTTGSPASSRR